MIDPGTKYMLATLPLRCRYNWVRCICANWWQNVHRRFWPHSKRALRT